MVWFNEFDISFNTNYFIWHHYLLAFIRTDLN